MIQRKDGKHLIVEVKKDEYRADIEADFARARNGQEPQSREGRKAVALRKLADLNPVQLDYKVVFAGAMLPAEALEETRRFVAEPSRRRPHPDIAGRGKTLGDIISPIVDEGIRNASNSGTG